MHNFQDPQELTLTKSPHRKFYSTLFPFTLLNQIERHKLQARRFGYSIRVSGVSFIQVFGILF